MSRIYFHSPSGTAEVLGTERAYAQILCHDLLCVALGLSHVNDTAAYRALAASSSYLHVVPDGRFIQAFQAWMLAGFDEPVFTLPDGSRLSTFHAALNTAVVAGSDPIRLLAKVHGQCEIHAYVEGPHRAWLADIIEQGINDKVLRLWKEDRQGWPAVVTLLRSRNDEPVVTSYSVTEQFPNRSIVYNHSGWNPAHDLETVKKHYKLSEDEDPAAWIDEYKDEVWYNLPAAERWHLAMTALRKANEQGHLEIHPDTFAQQGYGDGRSGFDIMALLYEQASVKKEAQ